MAAVGMKYPVFAQIKTEVPGNAITYEVGKFIGHAISADLTWDRDTENVLYGDDAIQESDNSVTGYSISIGTTELTNENRAYVLGEVTEGNGSEYEITGDDAPEGGFGYIRVLKRNGEPVYEGWWFHKLAFALTTESAKTKEKTVSWGTPTLEGTGYGVYNDASGKAKFAVHKEFDSEATALAWLKGKAGLAAGTNP